MRRVMPILLAALAVLPLSRGDVVHLRNGRTLEGQVEEETAAHVILQVGVGTVKLKRSSIRTIARSGPREAAALRDQWQERYFYHAKYVPEAYAPLAAAYRSLDQKRRGAVNASARLQKVHARIAASERRRQRMFQELAKVDRRLSGLDMKSDREVYNATVAEHNALSSRMNVGHDDQRRDLEEILKLSRALGGYTKALAAFRKRFREAREQAQADGSAAEPGVEALLNGIGRRLERFEAEFASADIPVEPRRGQLVVTVRLNDAVNARLLLDTGASTIVFSEALAARMGLDLASLPTASYSLADGQVVEGHPLILDSVQVGEATARHVGAAVLPDPPSPGLDGLLGMSFLQRFQVHVDPAHGKLVLKRFDP
jgi:clan AA aspartic protease (TIGR02281 family)